MKPWPRIFAGCTLLATHWLSGCASTSDGTPAGSGAAGGSGDASGDAGAGGLPACASGAVTFGICFVSDADVLPIPGPSDDSGTSTTGAASIEEVGSGVAPAQCEDARVFGTRGPSEWWFRAKAADGRVWTFGLHGLGAPLPLSQGDSVTLELRYKGSEIGGFGPPWGHLQLLDASAVPLLWAYTRGRLQGTPWLSLTRGAAVCELVQPGTCDIRRHEVGVALNGETATLAPFSAADVGGYHVALGQDVEGRPEGAAGCDDYYGESFDAVAVKLP